MKKTVTILGETIELAFNMAVQISYEDITQKPFDLQDMKQRKNMAALYFASIIVSNPDTKISFDQLIGEASGEDIRILDVALSELMADWYKVPFSDKAESNEGADSKPSDSSPAL